MKLGATCPSRPRICSWIAVRSTRRARAPFTAGSVRKGCTLCTLARSPSTLRPRIALVQLKVRDPASEGDGDLALAALLEALEDVVVDTCDSRGVVVLAGLEDRPRSRARVASAFDLERVEIRPVGDVIVGIQFSLQEISRL